MSPAPRTSFGASESTRLHTPPLLTGRIAELLAGKKIAMTGVTGFIGEQMLWKFLTECPDTTTAVLVRRKGSLSATQRVASLLKKKIFKDIVDEAGSVEELMDARIDVIEGDLPDAPELPRDIDVLVHCAGDVSFDPPIDAAFKTNVLGVKALLKRFRESCSDENGNLVRVPHYVHISTAYTAGRRRGPIPEAAHPHEVDYEAETRAALAMTDLVEARSRTSEQLTALRKEAEKLHRRAGYLTTSEDTERRRLAWVKKELVAAGTERARSLGWTDVYTFAKAMGEAVVADLCPDMQVSIVRPAIVESSLRYPHPGWIEGFKMADPIILAYGRGQLPEFPASPDAVIDIIPCDYVVNTIVAVCATQPKVGEPEFYHCSSGARNPLTFRGIYEHIRSYFSRHPYRDGQGSHQLATWNFPGPEPVERKLWFAEKGVAIGNRLLSFAPRGKKTRAAAQALDKTAKQLDFLNRYLSLYGEYLQSELHFVDDCTLALHNSLHEDDRETFGFDSGTLDWTHYLEDVHAPAITDPVRRLEAARRRRKARSATYRDLKAAEPGKVLAAFDLDGTVMTTNVIETYLWLRLPELSLTQRAGELMRVAAQLPNYLGAERKDRGVFLRQVYRRYEGARLDELERFVDERLTPFVLDRTSPDAVRRIREHREAGHTTILLTGVIRPLTRPFEGLFDHIVAADLATDADGVCTGFLTGPPMVGDSRAAWLTHYAGLYGIDLSASFAYADSHVDLPMLRSVGNPVAVSPDIGLMRAAKESGWSIIEWPSHALQPRWKLPS
ncbi:NAD-dependent epimerase/dehydratase family protein [Arachnia propionica]|uniref:SDR family oxidoreductase n=1 Tax=Arachnia propionica TaxID=1750 RepID=A0AB37I1L3_9ACTN|nr:SDR family oxidoreductase [Arachnia propionica]AFN44940.1 HAD hydrolase, family IB [Arachnia propionica F0230a]QCT37924.1 NAD-dependent epimerase/dehydratase family protein [Arachnia propionica]QUC12507.1 SDR family oxidoreductase [Arachnia propionica]RPA16649.1 NAD-dependent epimerase/dehydratase family protein [Arachnia propionica]